MPQIRIQLSQTLDYDQNVEIPQEEWDKIKRMDNEDAADALAEYLNLNDPQDWENWPNIQAENLEDDSDYFYT